METCIKGRALTKDNIYDPVTYVPMHANGNAGHKDCEQGVLIRWENNDVFVLYCKSRTIQRTNSEDLVWG